MQRLDDFRGDGIADLDEAGHVRFRHLGEYARVQAAEVAGADDADAGLHRMNPRFDVPRMNSTRYRASG